MARWNSDSPGRCRDPQRRTKDLHPDRRLARDRPCDRQAVRDGGWRVISCSRHAFRKNCPEYGAEDDIQVDLPNSNVPRKPSARCGQRLKEQENFRSYALANNAAISPKKPKVGGCAPSRPREGLEEGIQVNFFAPIMLARGLIEELAAPRRRGQCDLDRRLAGASLRGRGLFDLQGGAGGADARHGRRVGPCGIRVNAISPGETRPPSCRPAPRGSPSRSPSAAWASRRKWPTPSTSCAPSVVLRERRRAADQRRPTRVRQAARAEGSMAERAQAWRRPTRLRPTAPASI